MKKKTAFVSSCCLSCVGGMCEREEVMEKFSEDLSTEGKEPKEMCEVAKRAIASLMVPHILSHCRESFSLCVLLFFGACVLTASRLALRSWRASAGAAGAGTRLQGGRA